MGWHVEDIQEAQTVETVTDEDVAAAVAEAEAAEGAVLALEDQIVNGDETITVDDLERKRGESRFARLRAKAAERKAERARQAARLKACDQLRHDIEAHSTQVGRTMARALEKAEKALAEFHRLARERDATVHGFSKRATQLDLPRHMSPFVPGKDTAHLGLNEHKLIAGSRRVDRGGVHVDSFVEQMTRRAKALAKGDNVAAADASLYDAVARIDAAEDSGPADGAVFYTNATGRVFVYDRDPDEVAIRAGGLRKISRREAERIGARSH